VIVDNARWSLLGVGLVACAASASSSPFETASELGSEPRRAPGVAVDPAAELPTAGAEARAQNGLVVLSAPRDVEAARAVVRRFFEIVVAGSPDAIDSLLSELAWIQLGPQGGRQRARQFWRSRLDQIDYQALAGQPLLRESELETYRAVYRQVNGVDAPPPISAGWTFCDPSAERAKAMARRYIGGYYQTVLDHYQFAGDHLGKTKGYEYYGKMTEKIAEYGTDRVVDYLVNLQVAGTPEQCYERILDINRRTGNSHYVGVFSYAGMPYDEAERNMRLFAAEVMPELHTLAPTPASAPPPVAAGAGQDVRALGF